MSEVWRLLPFHVGATADHVAMSDALVRTAKGRRPAVWWHATDRPTLLVGPADKGAWSTRGTGDTRPIVVRRASGGGSVLAGPGVLGLDVVLPGGHRLLTGDIVQDYRWLGEVWRTALAELGVGASVLDVGEARSLVGASPDDEIERFVRLACFGSYSPFEVVVGARKIVGLSQVRRAGSVLLASGIHLDFDADGIARALEVPLRVHNNVVERLSERAVALRVAAGSDVTEEQVMRAFRSALRSELDVRLRKRDWTQAEMKRVHAGLTPSGAAR